jgi:hypothetical protein
MRNYKKEPTLVEVLDTITCDCCKKTFHKDTDIWEYQEMMHWETRAGYGSNVFGDGDELSLDLCQYCVKDLLGHVIVNHGNAYFPANDAEADHLRDYWDKLTRNHNRSHEIG